MPKISIIIPFNNGKKYLKNCLDSVTSINYDDYEIILIDDFSKDNSEEISKKYKNAKYFYTAEETLGVGNARNLGIEKASGKYIMFVDVDDTIDKNLLKNLQKYMEQDIDMIKYKMKIIAGQRNNNIKTNTAKIITELRNNNIQSDSVTGKKIKYENGPTFEPTNGEDAFNKLCFKDNYLDSPCLYLIKKDLFERTNSKFKKNVYHEDFGLIPLLLANAKTVVSTNIDGYNYYQSENSIMRNEDYSKKIKKVNDKFLLYDNLKKKLKNTNLKQKTCKNFLEYYTNSIIIGVKELKKNDRKSYMKKIKNKGMLNNLRVRNIKQLLKKVVLYVSMLK